MRFLMTKDWVINTKHWRAQRPEQGGFCLGSKYKIFFFLETTFKKAGIVS